MANLAQTASVFIAEHRALGAALVGLVAFGLGLVVASLIPASRTEQRAAVGVKEKRCGFG